MADEERETQRREILSKLTGKGMKLPEDKTGYSPLDGLVTNQHSEDQINSACASVFKTGAGKILLDYLRRLTVDRVAGPEVNPDALLHMEGGRWVYGILVSRNELGKQKK